MGPNNEILQALLSNEQFLKDLSTKMGKADTLSQATGLLWYDLKPVVQLLYPFKELIPLISKLPREPADGGNAFHWKRVTDINVNNVSVGVSEGNRGGGIAITLQDQQANYKCMGLEGSATFEARLGAKNLSPDALGLTVQSTLRSVLIGEEQALILGNASTALGTTPTPTLTKAGTAGAWGGTVTVFVKCIALSGLGWINATVSATGVPGSIVRTNTDGSTDTFGGGSANQSAEANIASVAATDVVTATVTPVVGAVAYAWYIATTTAVTRIAAITAGPQAKFTKTPTGTNQLASALSGDNSLNTLIPDGILSQIYGSVFGSSPGQGLSTNPNLPPVVTAGDAITFAASGAIVYTMRSGNTGITISGTNIGEFDAVLQAAYDQYKIGFTKILMSAQDIANFLGSFFATSATSLFRVLFDADQSTGRIVAGRRVTSYLNKFMGNTLDIEIHPFLPPGTIVFWSETIPYELSGVKNILEAHVRQDYYQIQWPFRSRRYEYGVYVDEVFAGYFMPAFSVVTGLNPPGGTQQF